MRILLVCLNDDGAATDGGRQSSTHLPLLRAEADQALALMQAMRDGGRIAPMLACAQGSPLHLRAQELDLPCLPLRNPSPRHPLTLIKLWLWQRRHRRLLIQSIGQAGVALAHRVFKMRKPATTLLAHAFPFFPPEGGICTSPAMLAAQHILYGSSHVRKRMAAAWTEGKIIINWQDDSGPLKPMLPGMDVQRFAQTQGRPHAAGERFIFGMAASLMPRSGALQVVRAMSAIWQRTDLPKWEMRMFGSGPRYREVLDEAKRLGVAPRLCILPDQPDTGAIGQCHAWLAPGSSPEETPETLWTGFAAGLPVICSQSSLHMERLTGDAYGYDASSLKCVLTVSENDPQALAGTMISLMSDAGLRHELAEQGKAIAQRLDVRSTASQTCHMFEQWLRALGARPGDAAHAAPSTDSQI